jgi:enoyl-CoA hydratase
MVSCRGYDPYNSPKAMDLQTLTYEVGDRVARITLNRPERGNGITPRMLVELAECVEP